MKKLITIIIASSFCYFRTIAGTPAEDKVKSSLSYKSPDNAVKVLVEKERGEVKLQVELSDMKGYDRLIIERSCNSREDFTVVKNISCADHLKTGHGGFITQADKYPANSKQVFYRVRTITGDGIERMYAAIEVPVTKVK